MAEVGDPGKSGGASAAGTAFGIAAYSMWGFFPLYWKRLAGVAPVDILAHRVVWACVFSIAGLVALRRLGPTLKSLANPKLLLGSLACGVAITLNWGIYIWAVNSGRILECSIGYYLNPLVSVLFGVAFFRERMDRWLAVACGLAATGIAVLTVSYGALPLTAVSLALTFATYGLLKKIVPLKELAGLASETLVMTPLALGYLLAFAQKAVFGTRPEATALLVVAGPVTAIPLLCYAAGVKRIPLSRMGFLQYISPTLQLSIGVLVYGERLDGARVTALAFVLGALAVYSVSRLRIARS